jgi:hypothetical protein
MRPFFWTPLLTLTTQTQSLHAHFTISTVSTVALITYILFPLWHFQCVDIRSGGESQNGWHGGQEPAFKLPLLQDGCKSWRGGIKTRL